jgi:hypothetical protein
MVCAFGLLQFIELLYHALIGSVIRTELLAASS